MNSTYRPVYKWGDYRLPDGTAGGVEQPLQHRRAGTQLAQGSGDVAAMGGGAGA